MVLLVDLAFLTLTACMFAVLAVIMAEQFPTRRRAMGVGAPYNLWTALFGATAPFLLTWRAGQRRGEWYFIYLAILVLLVSLGLTTKRRRGPNRA